MGNKIIIEFAHICENVVVANNGNLSIINMFNQIISASFPAAHPKMDIALGISREKGSELKDYLLKIKIVPKEEKEKTIAEFNATIKIPELPGQVRVSTQFSPVLLPKEGLYDVTISIDNEVHKILNLEAKKSIQ